MSVPAQIIHDANEQPLFAVLPYQVYTELMQKAQLRSTPQEARLRFVRLPYGGPDARLDVLKLVEWMLREKIYEIPVNQRAQGYDKFPADQLLTLDPLIRRYFLKKDSPYINTMQATSEVIDTLEKTGLFERSRMKTPAFFRAVNSIKLNVEKAQAFICQFPPLTQEEMLVMPS